MKTFNNLVFFAAIALVAVSCSSLLTRTAPADSLPVQMRIADTNTPATVAWLNAAQAFNAASPPHPYQPLITMSLTALGALATAAAGYFGHRHAQGDSSAKLGNVPAKRIDS
jgi:hypothetical protein